MIETKKEKERDKDFNDSDWTLDLTHAKYTLYHWILLPDLRIYIMI